MAYAELVEEAKGLSDNNTSIVVDFIKFLKEKENKNVEERKSNILAGNLKYIADDFDDTPDCFKEYM